MAVGVPRVVNIFVLAIDLIWIVTEELLLLKFAGAATVRVSPSSVRVVVPPLLAVRAVEVTVVGVVPASQPMVINVASLDVATLLAASVDTAA